MRRLLVCLALVVSGLAATTHAATSVEAFTAAAFEAMDARPAKCEKGLDAHGLAAHARCAVTEKSFKAVKKTLRRLLKKHDGAAELPRSRWAARGDLRISRFFLNRELYFFSFDVDSGVVAMMPDRPCFDTSRLQDPNLYGVHDDGVTLPEVIERIQPDYPAKARIERTSGLVAVQVLIDDSGQVVDSCVAYAVPTGLGFEERALSAVKSWRYTPARKDGSPVEFLRTVVVTWEIR